jgi:DNA invertase Pin-like site-specific DNA recombinase
MGNKNSGRRPDYERRRQIARLRAQGATLEEIGRRLGVTRQAVYDMLRRLRAADARKEPVSCR